MSDAWTGFMTSMSEMLVSYTPRIVGSVIILVVGLLIAAAAAALVGATVRRSSMVRRLLPAPEGPGETQADPSGPASRIVFFVVLTLCLIAVLQVLGLTLATGPLNELVTTVLEFIPRLVAAAALGFVAWIIASLFRTLVVRTLKRFRADERVANATKSEQVSVATAVGNALYWLVLLLFLPAVLGSLALGGMLQPVQGLVDQILAFLPNLLTALVIALVGWILARVVRGVVQSLCAAAGADRLGHHVGIQEPASLSRIAGTIAYVLVLFPIVVSALTALKMDAITVPAANLLDLILVTIPRVLAAAALLFLAYVVGRWVSRWLVGVLAGVGFDRLVGRMGLIRAKEEAMTASNMVGSLFLALVLLFSSIEALHLVEFHAMANIMETLLAFVMQVVLGVVIVGIGLFLASLASRSILASKLAEAKFLAALARVAITVLAIAMGLREMNLADEIVTVTFLTVIVAVGVAAAIAFGVGGRDFARNVLRRWSQEP